jgi:predicted dithiol-disulfide oxidoreductase (DUF899 family)
MVAPPGFAVRAVAVEPGGERSYEKAEWLDAIVYVVSGTIELRCLSGTRRRFQCGDVLWLAELPLRSLRNPGAEATLLLAVSRTRDDFFLAAESVGTTPTWEGRAMPEHKVGTREEWREARNELLERENEHAERSEELARLRRELPWVPVEKEYAFDTEDGKKTLAELFDGRSQLLAYNIMFGPSYEGACPGCSNLADHLDASLVHLNYRDVTLLCFSRAPLEKLQAYKRRMGWQFRWVSTYESDFPFDFELAITEEQAADIEEIQTLLKEPPDWLQDWSKQVGTELEKGLRENPSWIAFALEEGVVYHTYTRSAPDRDFVVPYYSLLLDRTPNGRIEEFRAYRRDEYPEAAAAR